MNYSEAIISGLLLGLFIAISVGPTLFAVIRYSLHHSYKAGIAFILGVSCSDIFYVSLANMATGLLKFLEAHQRIIGLFGSALFIGIGLYSLLSKYKPQRPKRASELTVSNATYFKMWLSGFLMNTLNPAVTILWLGAAIKITNSDYDQFATILFFGTCLGLVFSADIIKVMLADKIRTWLTLRKIMYLNKISAVFILIFGMILFVKVYFNINI